MAAPDETPQESAHRTPAKTADLPPVFRQRASGVVAAALDGDTLKLKDGTRVLYAIGEAAVKDGELHLGAQSFAVLG